MDVALQSRPRMVVVDDRGTHSATGEMTHRVLARLKADAYAKVIPVVVIAANDTAYVERAFEAGADEVLRDSLDPRETSARLHALLSRSDRDLDAHPSTRLPGAAQIDAELARRLVAGDVFAICYADIDHFKEFNDRYSYYEGDRVIRVLARILHDAVTGVCGEHGFVGHIGGDDFMLVVPVGSYRDVCEVTISTFDELIPYQYSEPDRREGYFVGKDRRGQLHRVPLMSISIGVATNERRQFEHPAQISELATEMKSYAKTLAGSVYTVDRRTDGALSPDSAEIATVARGA